jgi:hypothetical protein
MKKTNQSGFGLASVLLVVLTVALICGIGFYIYSSNNNDPVISPTAQNTQKSESTDTNVVKISELGIQLKVSDSLQDLEYIPGEPSGDNAQNIEAVGFITTKKLVGLEPSCSTKNGAPLGTLWKINGQYTNDEQSWELAKQLPEFFIAYRKPAMECSSDAAFNKLVSELTADLKTVLPTITQTN